MVSRVHYSSARQDWETPPEVFAAATAGLARYGIDGFDLDVAASDDNTKCGVWYTSGDDGLTQPWPCRSAWCNPPYGRSAAKWIDKATHEVSIGNCMVVAMLLPSRTDTKWFHSLVSTAQCRIEIEFLVGRIWFVGAKQGAPFPSLIVWFSRENHNRGGATWQR